MEIFFKFFYEFMMLVWFNILGFFGGILDSFIGIGDDFTEYYATFMGYKDEFNPVDWVCAVISMLLIGAIFAFLLLKIFKALKKFFKFRKKLLDEESLIEEIARLNREVLQLVDEKNSIMAMKVSQIGLKPTDDPNGGGTDGEPQDGEAAAASGAGRFVKLINVDDKYNENPVVIEDEQNYTLSDLVDRFRFFAAGRMKLYYERHLIMTFVAGMATSRLIILEGISGTGKTSLPYSWGKFLKHDSAICAVQPSWRDRSELIGYLNEFTKRFNETDFLKSIYDATFRPDIGFVVLDEMNLARVEYYFAEVLSVLEMPDPNEWFVDVVPDSWATDPVNLQEGKCKIPDNIWFVGTANNDDSTFSITDKVYDRATTIQINTKCSPFECDDTPPMQVESEYLNKLFTEAKAQYAVSDELLRKLDVLDFYVIENFRLAFGNRILKQIKDFIPVFIACGGTEMDGLDYMLTYKIFKKFEGLNIAFMGDNMKKLIAYLEKTFGRGKMPLAKAYIERLMKSEQ